MLSKLQWKIPTWKGALGVLAFVGGIVTYLQANPSTLPSSAAPWVATAGAVLIVVERVADSIDNHAAVTANAKVQVASLQSAAPLPAAPTDVPLQSGVVTTLGAPVAVPVAPAAG